MLTRLLTQNYRCLRDVVIDFEPLTVLVGPNASGKSTVLRALDPAPGITADDVWQKRPNLHASFEFVFDRTDVMQQKLAPGAGKSGPWGKYRYQRLQLDLDKLRAPNLLTAQTQLAPSGENLTNVFGSLTRVQQSAVAKALAELVPSLADVDVQPLTRGNHELRFQDRYDPNLWYRPADVSDGTILLTAYLTLQFLAPPPEIFGIEEPERGLHPYLVGELVGFLRKLTTGAFGTKPAQVIVATHSAELLEFVRPEEVRFFSRAPDGGVLVRRVDTTTPDWKRAFEEYRGSLGSAWLSGGLGGVPGAAAE